MSLPCNRTDNAQNYESEVDPGVVEVRVAVLRLELANQQDRGVTHPSQGGGPPTMSASHSKELPGTVSELVGRRFRIVPGVGLVDRDVNDHAQLLERVTGKGRCGTPRFRGADAGGAAGRLGGDWPRGARRADDGRGGRAGRHQLAEHLEANP